MMQKIDIFWPCEEARQLESMVEALRKDKVVKSVTLLERQPMQQMLTLRRIADEIGRAHV